MIYFGILLTGRRRGDEFEGGRSCDVDNEEEVDFVNLRRIADILSHTRRSIILQPRASSSEEFSIASRKPVR